MSARPPRVWHDELPHEGELLAALRSHPSDPVTRAVYADWLEDRGRIAQAAFVRGYATDERVLVAETTCAWRMLAGATPVIDGARCHATWADLVAVDRDEAVRTCATCFRVVRYCASDDEVVACREWNQDAVRDPG